MVCVVMMIVGFDSGGGVGIQVDFKMFFVLGVFGILVIIVIIVQNMVDVMVVEVLFNEVIVVQIVVVFDDIDIYVIKIGMLGFLVLIEIVVCVIEGFDGLVVLDLVMFLKLGVVLLLDDVVDVLVLIFVLCVIVVMLNLLEVVCIVNEEVLSLDEGI